MMAANWYLKAFAGIALVAGLTVAWFALERLREWNIAQSCTSRTTIIKAPNGLHQAGVIDTACAYGFGIGEENLSAYIAQSGGQNKHDFLSIEDASTIDRTDGPRFEWVDDRHLRVTIAGISPITLSLHQVGDVQVDYRLAGSLAEPIFKDAIEQPLHAALAQSVDPMHDSNVESAKVGFSDAWSAYRRLQSWAKVNVR